MRVIIDIPDEEMRPLIDAMNWGAEMVADENESPDNRKDSYYQAYKIGCRRLNAIISQIEEEWEPDAT